MILSKLIIMVLQWSAWMAYGANFIHESSHIQQTIPRSRSFKLSLCFLVWPLISCRRALLAAIRNNRDCPCPRCSVKKADISKLGLFGDIKAHLSEAQIYLLSVITLAVDFVYNHGYNLTSSAVERLLSVKSLVPTRVRDNFQQSTTIAEQESRMCSQRNLVTSAWIPTSCW